MTDQHSSDLEPATASGPHSANAVPSGPACSVLATGQEPSRIQRKGRYVPEAMKHPARMLPAIASQVITAYTRPGDLVIDPMCGIGTTLVEAIHLGRNAAGVEYEEAFAHLSARNIAHACAQGATGDATVACGDSRNITTILNDRVGKGALVLTSPPYGASTHGHIRSTRDSGRSQIQKWNTDYSADRGNLAHASLDELFEGFADILSGCAALLRPGGVVAITIRPIRVRGELIDLPGRVVQTAERVGLRSADRLAALLCGLRDSRVISRASFFQMLETRRARDRGIPACAAAHEDLLIFQRPTQSTAQIPAWEAERSQPAQPQGDQR
ncbi:TRM11 family SAM-dependent methyltransferase [Actinomadura rupiterrae]|uniref:TRM11 family SAM-dependent methyltransferase n=1 Tax=Actinomadura rupiterrae TaxID=559627 RepID=UPI0020A327DC|nr:DNA methyltransferase [Actinomadura rupiterrae]MCP2343712.1 tRNA1(Val) A37 N6-methylase TrmN6 [Actinomadura rupiterrae]